MCDYLVITYFTWVGDGISKNVERSIRFKLISLFLYIQNAQIGLFFPSGCLYIRLFLKLVNLVYQVNLFCSY